MIASEIMPRLPRRLRRDTLMYPVPLLCGFPSCDGLVGKLQLCALHHTGFAGEDPPYPFGPPELQVQLEAQAPESARRALLYVLPEGFASSGPGEWAITPRGRGRRDAIQLGYKPRRATRHPRPSMMLRALLYAIATPLPCNVRCPACPRVNRVTRDDLEGMREELACLFARAEFPGYLQLPNSRCERLNETLDLVAGARCGDRPVVADDFFVPVPDRPYEVSCPDPSHMAAMDDQDLRDLASRAAPS